MTEKDYLDKRKFPLTTQDGLRYNEQCMIDSFNWDQLIQANEDKNEFSERQVLRMKEFSLKLAREIPENITMKYSAILNS